MPWWQMLVSLYSGCFYEPRPRIELIREIFKLARVLFFGMVGIIALAYVINIDFVKVAGFIPAYSLLLLSVLGWRFAWRGLVGEQVRKRREKVVIFQNGDNIAEYSNFSVIEKIKLDTLNPSIPQRILQYNDVDGIVIESNGSSRENLLRIISRLTETKYEIYVSPKCYPLVYQYFLIQKVPDSPFLKVIFHPLSTWDQFLKRVIDIVLSITTLMILAPFLLVLGFFIKLDDPGPVFYKQRRVGFRGKEFILYKFRSMISDAERHTGPVWAQKNDARITRIGKIMRPFRLDELPQLFNVLKGDMSFVGPRPERPAFVETLKKNVPFYSLRLTVHPGITGLAQVKHTYDTSVDDVRRKLTYDLEYVNNMSLNLDLKIFLKTVLTVLKKEGAH
jgi:exopolysaccharide biosynthesis polyprenyl glycosylphosphotransferase